MSVRARLTAIYSCLFIGTGLLLVAVVYTVTRYMPNYQIVQYDLPGGAPTSGPTAALSEDAVTGRASNTGGVALTIRSTADVLNTLLWACAIGLLLFAVLGVIVSWIAAGRVLRSLDRITAAANAASDGNLHERIALDGPDDELKRLADTFDTMLARLERDLHAHQRFAANAAHELRTPLATTRTMLQVALADPDHYDLATLGPKLLATNARSITTTESLLVLAHAEQAELRVELVDLAQIAADVLTQTRPEAARRRVTLQEDIGLALVGGDPVLLSQLLTNLVHNAIRHNHPDGQAAVTIAAAGDQAVITVTNTGPIVPDDQVESLFEPFYRHRGRTAADRTPGFGSGTGTGTEAEPVGHGLGLPIVRAITEAHVGTLTAVPLPGGGLCVTVLLPGELRQRHYGPAVRQSVAKL
jgi:two-component system sensor histidine kinase VanS